MKKLISTILLLVATGASAQIRFGGIPSTTVIATVVTDTSGWQRIPASSLVKLDNTGDDVYIGYDSSDEAFAASSLVVKGVIASVNSSTNASYVSIGNVLGDVSFISADRTGAGTRLPLGMFAGGSERVRITTNGTLLVGFQSTEATDAAGQVYVSAGLNVASAATNGSLMGMSVAGGTSNLAAGRTSAGGTFLPMAFYTNGFERGRITTGGSLLMGLTSTEATDQSGYIYADGGISVVNGEGTNGSLLSLTIGGGTTNLASGRTSAGGSFLPLAFYTSALEKARFSLNGSLLAGFTTMEATDTTGYVYARRGVFVADSSADGSLIGLSIGGGTANLSAGRTSAGGAFLPLSFYTSGTEWMRIDTTTGTITAYGDTTILQGLKLATGAGASKVWTSDADGWGSWQSVSTSASVTDTGDVNIEADSNNNGVGSIILNSGGSEQARLTNSGDFMVGLVSSDEAFAAESIIANGIVAAVNAATNASVASIGNILGDASYFSADRTGAGSYLDFALFAGGSERLRVDKDDGGLYMNGATGSSQGDGTINAKGLYVNGVAVAAGGATDIGDTVEVDLFWAMDTTAANSSALELTALSSRRSVQYWSFDADNSDTLLFSIPVPAYIDSLEYVVPIFIANTNSGNYLFRMKWEFTANDAAFDNSLTMTNSTDITVSAPSASGDIRYARTSLTGTATDAGSNRWMDGMLIRVGGDGADTASGNADLIGFMLGWSRSK